MKMLKRLGVPKKVYKAFVHETEKKDVSCVVYAKRDCYLALCDNLHIIVDFSGVAGKCCIKYAWEFFGFIIVRTIWQNSQGEVISGQETFEGKNLCFDFTHLNFHWNRGENNGTE